MPQGRFRSLEDPSTLRQLVRKLGEGIYITNDRGEILDANPAFLEIVGVATVEEVRRFRARDLFVDPSLREREMEMLARNGTVREFEFVLRRPDGGERTVLDTCYAVRDPETGEVLFHGVLIDISSRKKVESRIQEASLRDPLTGCYNRRYLKELQKRLTPLETWAAIVVDVDNFKELNDKQGHQAGDEALMRVSRFLQQNARVEDAVVRMGGDEFLLLLLGSSAGSVAEIGQRLLETAEAKGVPPFSLGWAVRHGAECLERTIDHADRELLQIRLFERRTGEKKGRGMRQRLVAEMLVE
ncbi:MAG TPA: sensor domain-containing diguanylate cyclase [Thermoanaerobaculia bacterium]|nr:sensor domain-containing diguanylate cyclase [Thermoanaerobaculia bacterium]